MTMMRSTDDVLDELSRELKPVRRLWSPSARLAGWTLGQIVLAAVIVGSGHRPSLLHELATPAYLAELLFLSSGTVLLAAAGFGAAVPGGDRPRVARLGIAAAFAAALFVALRAADTEQAIATFVRAGVPCAIHTAALALLPTTWLLVASYRGFPLAPFRAGALAGSAGFLTGFALMRLLCPVDEPLHLAMWHWLPVALGTAAAGALGFALLRRRPTRS
jgi:hypothetical protein